MRTEDIALTKTVVGKEGIELGARKEQHAKVCERIVAVLREMDMEAAARAGAKVPPPLLDRLRTVLGRAATRRTAPHRTAHRTAPHRTARTAHTARTARTARALHRTAPHRTAPHRTAPHAPRRRRRRRPRPPRRSISVTL